MKKLKDYRPSPYKIRSIELEFLIFDSYTLVKNSMSVENTKDTDQALILDGVDQDLVSIKISGKGLDKNQYKLSKNSLDLGCLKEQSQVEIESKIYPHRNTCLEGIYLSKNIICSQCEAQGFRRITYFLDRPDILTKYRVYIEADKTKFPVLLAGGNLVDSGTKENNRQWVVWEDPFPKPSYLFALVAGDLACIKDSFTTKSNKNVSLEIYTHKQQKDQCLFAMESLKKAMLWDENSMD